ncbi:hypothetical protein GQ600_20398 [Phytophthora cactorum]|nr:hypothetical protein GQ600_20398 [Phytophthora cactorum]
MGAVWASTYRSSGETRCFLREVAAELEAHWGSSFQATTVTWPLWANHVTRNLNRSTWREAISEPPPVHIVQLLRNPSSQVEQRLSSLTRSARTALDCVNGALADNEVLRQDWNVFGQRLTAHRENLTAKKNVIEAFIDDLELVPIADVIDPLPQMENLGMRSS